MNELILNNLAVRRISKDLAEIVPFIYLCRTGGVEDGQVITVWLQYESPESAARHGIGTLENYLELPYENIRWNGEDYIMYLAKAVKNKPDDMRQEMWVNANGILWGWFPKELA